MISQAELRKYRPEHRRIARDHERAKGFFHLLDTLYGIENRSLKKDALDVPGFAHGTFRQPINFLLAHFQSIRVMRQSSRR